MASVADMAASADIDRLLSEHGIAAGAVALARMEIERLPLRPYGADPQRMREYDRVLTFAHDRLYAAVADLQAIADAIRARCGAPAPSGTIHPAAGILEGPCPDACDHVATFENPEESIRLAALRESSDGTLPAYVWPGGYPMEYVTEAGAVICPKCANDPDTSDPVVDGDVYWEGPAIICDDGSQCGAMVAGTWQAGLIESAYGDPETESDPDDMWPEIDQTREDRG